MAFVLVGNVDCPECEHSFTGRWSDSDIEEFACGTCGFYFVAQWRGFSFAPETEACP